MNQGDLANWQKEKDKKKLDLEAEIVVLLKEQITKQDKQLLEQKETNQYKKTQQENDNRFRNSWRWGKIAAMFFMGAALYLDVVNVNPAILAAAIADLLK